MRSLIAWIVSALLIAHVSAVVAYGGQEAVGELRIEGEGIKEVTLRDAEGRHKIIDRFDATVVLPTGEYTVQSVILQGGLSSSFPQVFGNLRVGADANSPATLTLGVPLRQVVKVTRQGSAMVIKYELIGRGGEQYRVNRSPDCPGPSITVYRGDRKVASGSFTFY